MQPLPPPPTEVAMRPTFQYPKAIAAPAVRDYVVWSLFSFTSCNCCCLGLFALFYSIKSRDRKVLGDPEGAANHGRTAKYLNIVAVTITIIVYIIFIIILISSALFIINLIFEIMKLPDEIEEYRRN